MPFNLPFRFPYFYNYKKNYYPPFNKQPTFLKNSSKINSQYSERKKNTEDKNQLSSEYFLEIFGLHLYFDDILILCLLFFLYTEEVKDYELFLCLIFLLIS